MERTNRIAAKGEERCRECIYAAQVTVTRGAMSIRVCPVHTYRYSRAAAKDGLTITVDANANVSICNNCHRAIGHKSHAAHNCYGATA